MPACAVQARTESTSVLGWLGEEEDFHSCADPAFPASFCHCIARELAPCVGCAPMSFGKIGGHSGELLMGVSSSPRPQLRCRSAYLRFANACSYHWVLISVELLGLHALDVFAVRRPLCLAFSAVIKATGTCALD
jgi:hypothetical protein